MSTPTSTDISKVLFVENNPDDLRLVGEILSEMSTDSFDLIAVKSHSEAVARLAEETIDVILLALALPDATGLEILTRMRAAVPHLPIVVVTEGSDETGGLQAVRAGAQDYLVKDNLDSRLLKRVLRNAIERKRADQMQRESEARYRSLFEHMLNGFAYCKMEFDQGHPQDFVYLEVNTAFETLTGLKNVVGKKVSEVIPGIQESDPGLFESYGRVALTGQSETLEVYVASLAMWFSIAIYSPQKEYFVAVFEVITERKRHEEELTRSRDNLEQLVAQRTAELQAAKGRAEAILDNSGDGILLVNPKLQIQQANRAFNTLFACNSDDYFNQPLITLALTEDAPLVTRIVQAGAVAGQARTIEIRARRKDDTVFDAEFSIGHIKGDGLVCTIRDITERKQAENALRESEALFRSFFEQPLVGMVVTSSDKGILIVNDKLCELLGYHRDELSHLTWSELTHPEDLAADLKQFNRVLAGEIEGYTIDKRFIRKDGQPLYTIMTCRCLRDPRGKGMRFFALVQDITERKQQEQQLRYHASLQENVTDAVIASDLQFRIQSWNPAAERIYGWRAEEVLGKSIGDVLPTAFASDETGERIQTDFVEKGYWSDEVVQYHKDGRALHILSSTVLFKDENGQPFGIVAVNHDITAHKAAELMRQAKAQEERAFQSALKELHEISLELTPLDTLDAFYRRVVELGRSQLGFERLALFLYDAQAGSAQGTYGTDPRGQVRDEHAFRMTPGPDDILMRVMDRAERFCVLEHAPLHDNEQQTGVGWNAAAALWNGSEMVGWLVADNLIEHKSASEALMEIFALYALTVGTLLGQKQAVTALRESEEKFRLFVEAAPEAIVICNRQGTITLVNAEAEQIFGYHRAELIGQAVELLVPEVQREVHQRHRDHYAVAASRRSGEALPEFPARRKDGSQFPAEIQLSAVQTEDDLLVISFIADISERKRAEEALQRALEQQKELVDLKSRFISMASHDFRTPMTVILSSSSLLEMQISRQFGAEHLEPLQKRLRRIDESVRQMTTLLDDVLTVNRADAGKVEVHAERLDVERLGEQFLQEIQLTAGSQHLLKCSFVGQESSIVSDPQLLRQILINLLSNAVKYSPEGGNVWLEVHCEPEDVTFRVQDEGIGIPESDQARLFEVFHRAHNVGGIRGTGLGMAIVKRAVDALGGTITFESQVNVGTTFIVQLPTALLRTH